MFAKINLKQYRLYTPLLVVLFFLSHYTYAQIQIWGASNTGSENGIGDIFAIYDDGSEYVVKESFLNDNDGNEPKTKLTSGSGGWHYGTTTSGGDNGGGSIFRVHEQNGFEVLYHFTPSSDGSNSRVDLLRYDNQTYVGATSTGGPDGGGIIFAYHLTNGITNLFNLNPSTTGSSISGTLFLEDDNTIYATCSSGGENGFGTIISFDLDNDFDVEHNFEGQDGGSYPQGGMVSMNDWYYGTTQFGGSNSQGTIFRYSAFDNIFEIVHNLDAGAAEGRYPFGSLIVSENDELMGTCSEGGMNGTGTVFRYTEDSGFINLHSFQAGSDGGFPKAGLTELSTGVFYGVTDFGGSNGFGTIYSIDSIGTFINVHNFEYSEDGSNPTASLAVMDDETLIGTSSNGGANNFGTVYTYNTGSGIENIHNFSIPRKGANPQSTQFFENHIYGTTYSGGEFNGGVLYSTGLDGSTEIVHEFHPMMDGQNPNGDLYIASDGTMYGTTRFGGISESGSVFTITNDGNFAAIHYFTGASGGQFPYAGVTQHSNGKLYGTTLTGGQFGNGTIYCINQVGEFEEVVSFFNFFNGGSPESNLIETDNGKLYGVATIGGGFNQGTLFELDPVTNTLAVIHSFQSASDGANPKGNIILHSDGSIYGTASTGANGGGSIWKYDFATGFEMLHAFTPNTEGSNAVGGLIEDENQTIYGFCSSGGALNAGTCFSYNDTDGLNIINHFSTEESPAPNGTPALFYPECYGDEDCISDDVCAVAQCNFGICEQIEIDPTFETVDIGDCELGLDNYNLEINISLMASPGGFLNIEGQLFEISTDVLDYTFTLIGLPANASAIDLEYTFEATGCSGNSPTLGTAPNPCPPVLVTFIVHTDNIEVDPAGMHVGGSFQNWAPSENLMAETGTDLWETTITVGAGSHEFNFFNGPSLFDGEYVIGSCAQSGKRIIEVGEESMSVEYCWALCQEDCSTTGISEQFANNLKVYPNIIKAGTPINIDIASGEYNASLVVMDMRGRMIQTMRLNGQNSTIETDQLVPGMYLIQLIGSNDQVIGISRFVVK